MPVETVMNGTPILLRVVDPWNIDEFITAHHECLTDPAYEPNSYVLVEWGTARAPTNDEIGKWVGYASRKKDEFPLRQAVVVSTELQFGMGRVAQAQLALRGVEMQVFRDTDSATAWLRAG